MPERGSPRLVPQERRSLDLEGDRVDLGQKEPQTAEASHLRGVEVEGGEADPRERDVHVRGAARQPPEDRPEVRVGALVQQRGERERERKGGRRCHDLTIGPCPGRRDGDTGRDLTGVSVNIPLLNPPLVGDSVTEKIPGLMGFVARTLAHEPEISSSDLYERSRIRYPAVETLSVRQFHARYPLQVKRQLADPIIRRFPLPKPERSALEEAAPRPPVPEPPPVESVASSAERSPSGRPGRARPGPRPSRAASLGPERERSRARRDAMRSLFFRFAIDLEAASGRADLVKAVARVDGYVDEAIALAGSGTG